MANGLVWLLKRMFTDILDKIIIFTTFMDKKGSKMQKKNQHFESHAEAQFLIFEHKVQ